MRSPTFTLTTATTPDSSRDEPLRCVSSGYLADEHSARRAAHSYDAPGAVGVGS